MKRVWLIVLVVVMLFTLPSCIEIVEGVSQEEYDALKEAYDAVVSERDALLNGYPIETDATEETEKKVDVETTYVPTPVFNEEAVLSQIEVTEYSYSNSFWHYAFLVVKNNSDFVLDISVSVKFYNDAGELIGVKEDSESPVASDTAVCMYFMPDEKFATMEYEISLDKEKYYASVVQDLTYETVSAKDKEIISVTNNGRDAAEFVQVYALFFNGDEVVGFQNEYITDKDYEIKPGKTISVELNCYEKYTSVKYYLTGRKLG